jgi:hypothetical protein
MRQGKTTGILPVVLSPNFLKPGGRAMSLVCCYNTQFRKDPDAERWNSRLRLKQYATRILCPQCGVLRTIKDFKPLAKVVVLAECNHERQV